MSESIVFTVFTPTFNRAHTLPNVYRSLCEQTFSSFEWLVVDDGSTDGTEALIRSWQQEARIAIRYFYQVNAGKHVALNRGVAEAKGELFLNLDSDDTCISIALERFYQHWTHIPLEERSGFSGVTCLCADTSGKIIGDRFPLDVFDSDAITVSYRLRLKGEKWGFHQTAILRKFPFPVFDGERFISEGLVWNRIAQCYRLRFINEPLRIFESLPGGLSDLSLHTRSNSPMGACLYYLECSKLPIPIWGRMRSKILFWRFYTHGKQRKNKAISLMEIPKFSPFCFIAGKLIYWIDSLL